MFKLIPAYKDYIWGGSKLKSGYGKDSDLDIVAESWELSTHGDGLSIIANGEWGGKSLREYVRENGKSVLGTNCCEESDIPILIKLIDAKQNLSVQVHPDDEYAKLHENDYGKTEMWIVLEAEENANLIYGLNTDLTPEEFKQNIENNTLAQVMNFVPVQKGDIFFIKAGLLHAIGAGIVIAEIQQRSNITYRVNDFGRLGPDGKPRELHIDKAIDVTCLKKVDHSSIKYNWDEVQGNKIAELVDCKYFKVLSVDLSGKLERDVDHTSFEALLILEGKVRINNMTINKGETVFVPANTGKYELEGIGQIIISKI
ncbi:mannose-6-phosphate isomerase [Candidatus Epulonipiscioides saccharophilum]|nr:mannose-6-phosphate isomerase [Epulopiscium sp. SCG-B10WGA-EpuloB]